MQRALLLGPALVLCAVSACNCDDDLYVTPGSLHGVVCEPVSGAGVGAVPLVVTDANGAKHEATSDASGFFTVDKIAPGTATLTIQGPDGERTAEVLIISREEATWNDTNCHAPPEPPVPQGSVAGCVCDDAVGQWVGGANVYISTDSGVVVTGTDDVGCFLLGGVPPGDHTLKIDKGAFYREVAVTVADGVQTDIESPATCEPPPPPDEAGNIDGRVCAPDGVTWLAGADVYVERADGTRSAATTDGDGRYHLTGVPPGSQTVHIEKGSFSTTITVVVVADQTTTVPEDQCQLLNPTLKIAVFTGQWDHVEEVLDNLGVDQANVTLFDGMAGSLFDPTFLGVLDDYAQLAQFDILFFNCGINDQGFTAQTTVGGRDDVARDNLRRFVAEGGSIYASDQAYDLVERAWPDMIDFQGDDAAGNSAQQGIAQQNMQGEIMDPGLTAAMGTSTITLHYPLDAWAVMTGIGPNVTLYLRADASLFTPAGTTLTDVPHTVGFNAGAGRVIYTSFHQEPGVSPEQERVLQLLMFEL